MLLLLITFNQIKQLKLNSKKLFEIIKFVFIYDRLLFYLFTRNIYFFRNSKFSICLFILFFK